MILKQIQKQVDGSLETQWVLNEAQTRFLLNFAITELLRQGIVQVMTEVVAGETEEDIAKNFLEEVDPAILHKA